MKSMWTGSIGFGLVNIPIKLYTATQSSTLDLDMLDKSDNSHIKYMRVNESTGKEVPWENIVKGYKYDDRYIVLDDSDFEKANAKKTKLIEISDFVKAEEIDSLLYESSYYVAPDKSGVRAFYLLKEALQKTKKVGIASFVMRNKENLALLRPADKLLILHRLHFAEEVRKAEDIIILEQQEIKDKELEMAVTLINQLSGSFDINQYKNTYTEELMKLIEEKAKGLQIEEPKLKITHSKSKDLMEQLKASLEVKRKKAS